MNYCIARSRSNSSSEPVKNLHNCSETEILIKLEQKPPTRSMKTIFRKTEKGNTSNFLFQLQLERCSFRFF